MAYCNTYVPPTAIPELTEAELYGPEPYDLNFCFPIDTDALENDRVKVVPFVPRIYLRALFEQLTAHPELFRYMPFGLPTTIFALAGAFEHMFRRDPSRVMFAIIDKTRPPSDGPQVVGGAAGGAFAGIIGFLFTSPQNLSTELGFVLVFPAFQRTHVLSNAVGLLLHYSLNLPSDPVRPGLGLRRVQWQANTRNDKSVRAAERIGFRCEATMRWYGSLPNGMEGYEPRKSDPLPNRPGRDSVYLAICWDDWESGVKEKVQAVMDRRA
ncbi:acyl-CoA N-acyltransferase [Phellopilus nigrolimitatus]|nr:acyl-CoA N-acyltransferase [Phellopilus nigrolimitatus]